MRLYLSEILAAVGWGAYASLLRRYHREQALNRRWWEEYRHRMKWRWENYGPERLGRRDEN